MISGSPIERLTHDAFYRWIHIKTTDTTGPTVIADQAFVWCGERLCQERDGTSTGTVEREIYFGGHQEGSTNRFYLQDHLGSVRGIVNDSEALTTAFAYDPYGRMTTLSGSEVPSYAYAQIWHHGQTGLSLAVYRAYDADVGRWISRDPLGYVDGANLYQYVRSDPGNLSDPTGQFAPLVGALILGGELTAAGEAAVVVVSAVLTYVATDNFIDFLDAVNAKSDAADGECASGKQDKKMSDSLERRMKKKLGVGAHDLKPKRHGSHFDLYIDGCPS